MRRFLIAVSLVISFPKILILSTYNFGVSFIWKSISILVSSIIFSVNDALINSYCFVSAILSISFKRLLILFDEYGLSFKSSNSNWINLKLARS